MGDEEPHRALDWPPSDILVSYDPDAQQIRYSAISTNETLMLFDVATGQRVKDPSHSVEPSSEEKK